MGVLVRGGGVVGGGARVETCAVGGGAALT